MLEKSDNLENAVNVARIFLDRKIGEGDVVVDATCGNGHDTLFLAGKVSSAGQVYAFDIQSQATDQTRALLEQQGLGKQVHIILDGHEKMDQYVPGNVRAVVFNLGYLPGSDKKVATQEATTVLAVKKALSLLAPLGIVVLAIYPGHDAGQEEKEALLDFASTLPQSEFNVMRADFVNHKNIPPSLLIIEKRMAHA